MDCSYALLKSYNFILVDMLVRFRYLKRIKNRLAAGRLSLSDAILSALKFCRGAIPESHLRLLNRELLGYLTEESEDIISRFSESESIATNWSKEAPLHRLLVGSWVPLSSSAAPALPESKSQEYCFYSDGICELELLLARVSISDHTWIGVAKDQDRNRLFMCTTRALQNVYDLAKSRLCEYLEWLAQEVLSVSISDKAAEARLILLLTRRDK
ncbi:MAG: hypothetical protein C5B53_05720 [Candidatus Melainabacteria bacterium]|nr:MAG: hypothetical protein C5B53_05720 [Candidatus Melainabacteria bacterium]